MTAAEIKELNDDELLVVCEQRGGRYNKYTQDALKAQSEWKRRRDVTLGFSYGGTNPHIWDGHREDNR